MFQIWNFYSINKKIIKAYLADPSAFAVAAAPAAAAEEEKPAAAAAPESESESDDDMGFDMFG